MDRNSVITVRIYFIEPVNFISIIINSLIELEFETYTIPYEYKEKLIHLIPENNRNVIFLSIKNKKEVDQYLEYAEQLSKLSGEMVQIGAFVYDNMDDETKNKFLENNISTIEIAHIQKDTIGIMKNILMMFEARGKRAFIRTKVIGDCKSYFYLKNKNEPVVSEVVDVSANAYSCKIPDELKFYFTKGDYIDDVTLVLRGLRIKITAKVIGFSTEEPNLFVFKICNYKIVDSRVVYEEKATQDNVRKIHEYIRKCLQEIVIDKLERMDKSEKKKSTSSAD